MSPEPRYQRGLVWFRRDLRFDDQGALHHALCDCRAVWCVFVFDTEILEPLLARGLVADRRVEFIRASVAELSDILADASPDRRAGLIVRHGRARDEIPKLASLLNVDAVYANHDYEPDATERDATVVRQLEHDGRLMHTFKDQVIFEKDELMTQGGTPFSVFTPYKRAWLQSVTPRHLSAYPVSDRADRLAAVPDAFDRRLPSLESMGFTETNLSTLDLPTGVAGARRLLDLFVARIDRYHETRDFPGVRGTSYLSVHLRFGTISIRALARAAIERRSQGKGPETWLSELIWRDFYFQILHHRPDLARGAAFKPSFDRISWNTGAESDRLFDAWRHGATGYPLIDAAMAQINSSGYMHNRLRMVTASFLSKDLGLDWRRGERYFAERLNDFDLAANNGGWQWASSSGCDAQPWFRIFNPVTQSEKFDPEGRFIRRYLPGLAKLSDRAIHAPWLAEPAELERAGIVLGRDYPHPVVDHQSARQATLERYAVVKPAEPAPS